MKKIFLILIALVVQQFASAQTNVYHPFPDSNAQWNYHWQQNCFWNGLGNDYYSFTISGDTVINTMVYHKLFVPFVASLNLSCSSYVSNGYNGAFRQDTSSREVFFIESGDSSEMLLFDFNMQVGDTVRGYTQTFTPYPDVVISIDSVLVGSNFRKRWYINNCYNIYFIEGVGSTYGLICRSSNCVTDLWDYTLNCFSENGQTLFPDTTTNCDIINSIKKNSDEKRTVVLSPNPFHTSAKLEIGNKESDNGKYEFKIYNSIGSLVREEQILQTTSYILNRCALNNGLYFFLLTSKENEQIGSGPFVIE